MSKLTSVVALSAFSFATAVAPSAFAGSYTQGTAPAFDLGSGQGFVTQAEMIGTREGRSTTRAIAADGSTSFDLTPGSTFLTQGQLLAR